MNTSTTPWPGSLLSVSVAQWLTMAACVVLLMVLAWENLVYMVQDWFAREEYSYGVLLPPVALYLMYMARGVMRPSPRSRWLGVVTVLLAVLIILAGRISTIHALVQYAFVLGLIGVYISGFGLNRDSRHVLLPLSLLFLMVPLPHFVQRMISADLQLLSSEIGVWLIKLFGISVYLEGNVVDLGIYQLQVLEACDGLRYLFPLMTVGLVLAYLYNGRVWERSLLFLSTIPLTVLMNSLRIGIIGIMVEYWGVGMAEGFLHDFQGWAMFLLCVVILLGEAKLLALVTGKQEPLLELFRLEEIEPRQVDDGSQVDGSTPLVAAMVLLAGVTMVAQLTLPLDQHYRADRQDLLGFPLSMQPDWIGERKTMAADYIDTLKFDDYLLVDYSRRFRDRANLYVAYYESQQAGRSIHSPKTCLPGDGWEITQFDRIDIGANGSAIPVNRAVISKGTARQLVYYWFEQRGRVLSNEYLVKWYILYDSVLEGRSDGAIVRLMTPVEPGQSVELVEAELRELALQVKGELDSYVSS